MISARDAVMLWDAKMSPTVLVLPLHHDCVGYTFSGLGAYRHVREMSDQALRAHCMRKALELILDYGLPPADVHSAMSQVIEYREARAGGEDRQ